MAESSATIAKAQRLVAELYEYRDNYFVDHPVCDQPSKRQADVDDKLKVSHCSFTTDQFIVHLQETLEKLAEVTEGLKGREKAYTYSFLRGKALNINEEFSQEAFELLGKAAKLDPQQVDAWNQLGECYWKKGDLQAAYNCFESALKHNKQSTESLRNLSICLRQVGNTAEERAKNLMRSLDLANEAVKLDISDGQNWATLGNAYMTAYCKSRTIDPNMLQQSKRAYLRAKLDKKASNQPDFLYNYSNLLLYEEDYAEALECLRRASLMDPSWSQLSELRNALATFLKNLMEMIEKRASLKPKRLNAMLAELSSKGDSQVGIYTEQSGYTPKMLQDLIEGRNEKSVVVLKVIGSVTFSKPVCKTICVIDANNHAAVVSIFNAGDEPKIGDTYVIADAVFRNVSLRCDSKDIAFASIRVDRPDLTLLNGKPFNFLARPLLTSVIRF